MSSHQLVALVVSHFVVACTAWFGCRYVYGTRLSAKERRLHAIEAEANRTVEQLREVRDQFRALEAQLIHVQLVMEQTQERLEARAAAG